MVALVICGAVLSGSSWGMRDTAVREVAAV